MPSANNRDNPSVNKNTPINLPSLSPEYAAIEERLRRAHLPRLPQAEVQEDRSGEDLISRRAALFSMIRTGTVAGLGGFFAGSLIEFYDYYHEEVLQLKLSFAKQGLYPLSELIQNLTDKDKGYITEFAINEIHDTSFKEKLIDDPALQAHIGGDWHFWARIIKECSPHLYNHEFRSQVKDRIDKTATDVMKWQKEKLPYNTLQNNIMMVARIISFVEPNFRPSCTAILSKLEKDIRALPPQTTNELMEHINSNMIDAMLFLSLDGLSEKKHNVRGIEEKKALLEFDLPKSGDIVYLRLFPLESDSVVKRVILGSVLRGQALQKRYGNRVEVKPAIFSENCIESLEKEIAAQKGASKCILIDLFSHGMPDYLDFPDKPTAEKILNLFKRDKTNSFVLSTIACFGGGLRNGFISGLSGDEDLKKKVQLFTQSDPEHPNVVGQFGSAYEMFLTQGLWDSSNLTYGAAVEKADEGALTLFGCDAEAVIDGTLITRIGNSKSPVA